MVETNTRATEIKPERPSRRIETWLIVLGLPALAVFLVLMTPEKLEQLPASCIWARLTGTPCPGCGTTRALCCVLHGEFVRALTYNRNVVLVAPLLVGVWVGSIHTLIRPHAKSPTTS